jgi:hypothetical protein
MRFESEFHNIVWQEFASYYLSGEIPNPWQEVFIQDQWLKITQASVNRMKSKLEPGEIPKFVEMLELASQDQSHSLVQTIDTATESKWSDEPESWRTLSHVLQLMVQHLKEIPAS